VKKKKQLKKKEKKEKKILPDPGPRPKDLPRRVCGTRALANRSVESSAPVCRLPT
jgi:hypothetical protein